MARAPARPSATWGTSAASVAAAGRDRRPKEEHFEYFYSGQGRYAFYELVFGCVPVPPQRKLSGAWLEAATGVPDAALEGEHLRLPGYGEGGPTLEIFSYETNLERPAPAANRLGFGHIALEVDDVRAALDRVLAHGGRALGQVQSRAAAGHS